MLEALSQETDKNINKASLFMNIQIVCTYLVQTGHT